MKKILCVALCLLLLTGLVGCDSSPKYDIYYFVEMVEYGVTYNAADLQKELDEENSGVKLNDMFYVKLFEDGTAVNCAMGIEKQMKYSDTEIWSVEDDSIRASYTRDGDYITIQDGDAKITYKKG